MATTIKLKNGSGAPTTGDLVQGEPAFDLTNKRLYTEDSGGSVIEVGTNPTSLTTGGLTTDGTVLLQGDSMTLKRTSASAENYIVCTPNSSVDLFWNGASRLTTTSTGIDVTGDVNSDSLTTGTFTSTGIDDNATSTAITIDSSENVGIGTASPSSTAGWGTLLEVSGTTNAGIKLTETDTANGDYSIGVTAGTLRVWDETTSSWRMTIDGSGFVGIGTASPTTNLDVRNNISMGDGTSVTQLSMIRNSANYIAATNASGYLVFRTGGTNERMRIDSSGNVSIGTSNSLGVLTIKAPSSDDQDIITITEDGTNQSFSINGNLAGAGSTGNVITLDSYWANDIIAFRGDGNVGIGTTSPNATLAFGGSSDVAFNTSLGSTGTYGQIKAFNTLAPSNPATNIRFIRDVASVGNDGAVCFDTVNTERMRINSSGNVGIGTTSPSVASGSGLVVYDSSASRVTLRNATSGDASTDGGGLVLSGADLYLEQRESANLILSTSATERMRIDSSGNLILKPSGKLYLESSSGFSPYLVEASNALTVNTNGSERMRIDSSGNLLVKKLSSGAINLGFAIEPDANATDTPFVSCTSASTSSSHITWATYSTGASNYRFYATYSGAIHAVSTSITAISDESLKENIRDLDKGLETINALQPRRFDWKNGDGNDIMGFIAQEVEEVMPELVHDYKYTDEENKKGLKMGDMVPSMVKAIQELSAQVNELKAEVAALKGE